VAVKQDQRDDDDSGSDQAHRHPERFGKVRRFLPQIVCTDAVDTCPHNAAGGIEQQKARPAHAVGAGEEGCKRPQHDDKAAKENDLAPVTNEKVLAEPYPAFGQSNVTPVSQQNTVAYPAPNPEADVVAENRANRSGSNHKPDVEVMRRAGVDRRGNQRRLAGSRHANAFETDDPTDHPAAIR
jgi:hypothetical protein